jgi:hypothetical protein
MEGDPMTTPGHGSQHPLATSTGGKPWVVSDDPEHGELWAWRLQEGHVVLQGDDGDITIPAHKLALVARSLLAVHVHNGRPDVPTKEK